jgi:hypothetical protein
VNGRICKRCGRKLYDPDKHTLVEFNIVDDEGRVVGKGKERECHVRLIADDAAVDLATGERVVRRHVIPETPQRTAQNNARYVPEDLFGPGKTFSLS